MTTLQEYLDSEYLTKEDKEKVKKIELYEINKELEEIEEEPLEHGELDLSEYIGLEEIKITGNIGESKPGLTKLVLGDKPNLRLLSCPHNNLSSLDLSGCPSLETIDLNINQLTSTDFLKTLPNPERLDQILIRDNNIQSTDISVFKSFINLYSLVIGSTGSTMIGSSSPIKHNKFYGSLESLKDLTKLFQINIEATDIDSGLEYLSTSLLDLAEDKMEISCSPYYANDKCKALDDELEPFGHDIEAWQLAHPEKMMISKPHFFAEPNSWEKWLDVLNKKIKDIKQEQETAWKQSYIDFSNNLEKKAQYLESKLAELQKTKKVLVKSTQTDLTNERIEAMEKVIEQLSQIQLPLKNK